MAGKSVGKRMMQTQWSRTSSIEVAYVEREQKCPAASSLPLLYANGSSVELGHVEFFSEAGAPPPNMWGRKAAMHPLQSPAAHISGV